MYLFEEFTVETVYVIRRSPVYITYVIVEI